MGSAGETLRPEDLQEHLDWTHRCARALTGGDAAEAEDLMGDAVRVAFDSPPRLEGPGGLRNLARLRALGRRSGSATNVRVKETMFQLFCPFESSVSPFVNAVQQRSLDWSRRFSLFDSSTEQAFSEARFAHLAARTFPYADQELLQLIADWTSWLFAFDDRCDRAEDGRAPDVVQAYADSFIGLLNASDPGESPSDLIFGLFDLRRRMVARSTPKWMVRFNHSALDYFDGCVWEAGNRARQAVPEGRIYRRMRRFAGAVETYLDFAELASGLYLEPGIRKDPDLQKLVRATNNVACWTNDLYSAARELGHGDLHNLVIVLMTEGSVSYDEAVARVCSECNDEVRMFVDLQLQVLKRLGNDPMIERYCHGLRSIIRGNLDWCIATARYSSVSPANAAAQAPASAGRRPPAASRMRKI